jgi:NAD(P)H dehydrogenase (quinone)
MTIAITGGSGKLGRLAAEFALDTAPARELVVTTRTPQSLADLADRGADVRYADFDRPESLRSAFAGVDRLLVISASNATGKRHDEHSAAITAAQAAGVQRILFTSMPNVDDHSHPSGLVAEEYRDAEQMIAGSGLSYTILRIAPYAELNAVERFILFADGGTLRMNSGDGRIAFISRRDVAASAAAALVGDDFENQIIDITGPGLHTFAEVAAMVGSAIGQKIDFESIGDEEFLAARLAAGDSTLLAEALTGTGKAFRDGYFEVQTSHAARLLGQQPQELAGIIADNATVLKAGLSAG